MANEIHYSYDDTKVLYAIIRRVSDQYIYDVGHTAFEAIGTWNDIRVGECDIAMTASGDNHFANFPAVAAGVYTVQIRERLGASPDTDDTPVAQGEMYWNGTTEGGAWTSQKESRIIAAWVAGNWRQKAADLTGTIKELLDPADGTTVILEMTVSITTPYRTITVLI